MKGNRTKGKDRIPQIVGSIGRRFKKEEDSDLLKGMLRIGFWYLSLDGNSARQPEAALADIIKTIKQREEKKHEKAIRFNGRHRRIAGI